MERGRYQYLDWEKLLNDLYAIISKPGKGNISPEAFLDRDANLRFSELNGLLKKCALNDLNRWIAGHKAIRDYGKIVTGGHVDAVKGLADFVAVRNEAAHEARRVTAPLGKNHLLDYVSLIDAVCTVISEYLDHTIVTLAKKTNSARGTALVRHVYKRVGALVVTAQEIDINVGDELWAVGDLHCFRTVVKSICVGPLKLARFRGGFLIGHQAA